MKSILTISLLMIFISINASGQDTSRLSYIITTLPTQYLFNDYSLTVEKVFSNRKTLGITLAYRPSTQSGGTIDGGAGLAGIYSLQNFWNDLYNGITIGINSKHYISTKYNLFIDANVFYRYWWFDKKNCHYDNVEGYRFNGLRTEKQNVYGCKILFGNSFKFRTKFKLKPIIDLYCGVGLRYKNCEFETFNGTVDDIYYQYKKDTESYITPTIHFGFKTGIGFKQN